MFFCPRAFADSLRFEACSARVIETGRTQANIFDGADNTEYPKSYGINHMVEMVGEVGLAQAAPSH